MPRNKSRRFPKGELFACAVFASIGASFLGGQTPQDPGKIIIVAADGSGAFRTVQGAIDAVPKGNQEPISIRIKPGIYTEHLEVPKDKTRIKLLGEDAAKTILTFNLHANALGADKKPIGTMRSSSTNIRANDFTAENLTFANSTPKDISQALAVAALGDRQTYRNCRFLGWQDTVYLGTGRQYFVDCYIEGGVDFIFGPATAVFKNCEVRSIRKGYLTAASTAKDDPFGFVFIDCKMTASADLPDKSVYLGRPWRDYGQVTFVNCVLGPHIRPEGWHNWNMPAREKTARFTEFGSTGPGAAPAARVPWSRQLTEAEAKALTPQAILAGKDGWKPK
jgi:pectinesterase